MSPVVGVMLMLVVTIIIAAIVASFASGLPTSTSPAPSAGFDYTIHAGPLSTGYTPVRVVVTASTGEMSSHDLQIITSYTVPNTYNGQALTNAGRTIIHTIDGNLENHGMSLNSGASVSFPSYAAWNANDDPFIPRTHLYTKMIVPSKGNGLTVGESMNERLYFGGTAQISSGTEWWFQDINQFLGFDTSQRTVYGFGEGSVVHITVVHVPSGTILSDKDVIAVW